MRSIRVTFTVAEDDLKRILDSLESAADACWAMSTDSAAEGVADAAESWKRDVDNLDRIGDLIREGKEP